MSIPTLREAMAVGGGDAFSLSATMLTLILLWSIVQWSAPWWLPELAKKYPDNRTHLVNLDRTLTLLPALLLLVVMFDLARAHYAQDLTYSHVANYAAESSSTLPQIIHGINGPDAFPWMLVIYIYALSVTIQEGVKRSKGEQDSLLQIGASATRRAQVLRWHGFIWMVVLVGLIPSDAFAVFSEPQPYIGAEQSGFPLVWRFIAGISLALWVSRIAQFSEDGRVEKIAPSSTILTLSLFLIVGKATDGVSLSTLSEILALGRADDLSLITSLALLTLGWPLFLALLQGTHDRRGMAKGRRWLALQRTLGHTLLLTWLSGAVILETLPQVNGWGSACWLSLTLMLPLAVAGLIGTLLPMAGLDGRPRPEVWGFYLMMSLALPLLTIRQPLSALLVPGLFMSMTSLPLLATHPEKRPDLPVARRAVESATIIAVTVGAVIAFHYGLQGSPNILLFAIVSPLLIAGISFTFLAMTPKTAARRSQESTD